MCQDRKKCFQWQTSGLSWVTKLSANVTMLLVYFILLGFPLNPSWFIQPLHFPPFIIQKKKKMERLPHAGWMMGFWKGKPSRDSSVTCSFPVPRRMFSFLFHCIPHFFFSPPSISPCLEAPCLCTFWIWNLSATEAYQQAAYLLLFSLFLLFGLLFSLCWSSFFFLGKIKLQFYFSTSKCTHIINKRLCHSLLGLRKGDCYSQKKTFRKNCFRLYGLTNLLEKNFFWCQM